MTQSGKATKKYLPHLIIVAIFIVISVLFCLPAFQGNTLNQHDTFSWMYSAKENQDYLAEHGRDALWTNTIFSGMPTALIDYNPRTNWYHKVSGALQFHKPGQAHNPAAFFLLAMLSFYVLMNALRINHWIGAIGAIAFAFSSYNPIIISAGHVTKMLDIAFLPGLLGGVLLAYRDKVWLGAALAGLFLAFFIDAGHYQIIYYGMMVVFIFAIGQLVMAIQKKKIKTWAFASIALAIAAVFAVMTSSSRLIQTQEYSKFSTRGGNSELNVQEDSKSKGLERDYAFAWSNGIGESFCVLVPNLYGGGPAEDIGPDSHFGQKLASLNVQPQIVEQITSSVPLYWGPQSYTQPIYFGAIIVFLTILSLFVIKNKFKWWIAGTALFFFAISVGNNFSTLNYFLFDHFPLMSKFRTPSMALAIPSILFPLLGMWALRDIFKEKISKEQLLKKLKLSVIITGGLCVVILLASVTVMEYKGNNDTQIAEQYGQAFNNPEIGKQLLNSIREDRASAVQKDAFRSLIFILLAGGVLYAFGAGKVKKELAIAGIGLFIMLDEIPVANRFLNKDNYMDDYVYEQQFQPRDVDAQIMKDPDPYYRVFDLTNTGSGEMNPFNSAKPSYFHKSIGGYSATKMEIYKELIDGQLSRFNTAVLNMLNMKYLIVPGADKKPIVQPNPNALGNAWFVSEIKWANNANEAMEAMNAPGLSNPMDTSNGNFNPAEVVVLRTDLKDKLNNYSFGKDEHSSIRLNTYAPDKLTYTSENSQPGLAVFSDIYYPDGWTVTVDGKEVEMLRANYVLRALPLPAGKHEIVFSFMPSSYKKGENLALIGSILLTLLIGAGLFFTFKNKKEEDEKLESTPAAIKTEVKPHKKSK